MTLDWSVLRSLTARDLIGALSRDGFSLRSQAAATSATATRMVAA